MFRTRYTLLLALIAFLGVIIGSCTAPSASAATVDMPKDLVGHCRYVTYVNMYATAGEDVDVEQLLTTVNYFPVHRCKTEGMRLEISFANTKDEIQELRYTATKPSRHLLMFCRTGTDEGYMLSLAWIFNRFDVNKVEEREFPRWFNNYALAHNCRR